MEQQPAGFKMFRFLIFITLVFVAHSAVGIENLELANLDCESGTYVETTTCNNSVLLKKHSIVMSLTSLNGDDALLFQSSHRVWVKKIESCNTAECVDIQYILRAKYLAEVMAWTKLGRQPYCSGATIWCYLIDRVPLGTNNGNIVYLDKYEITHCFKGCSEPELQFTVYEVKDGKRVVESAWGGIFKNQKVELDYFSHLDNDAVAYSDIDVTTVKFGFRPWTGEDDYHIVLEIRRDQEGWKAIGDTSQIIERHTYE